MARYKKQKLGYRSGYETKVHRHLQDKGMDFKYESETWEYEIKLRKNQSRCNSCGSTDLVVIRHYTPDFFLSNGNVIEAKGLWTADGRRIAREHPHVKMLFQRNNRLSKSSSTKYSDFCERWGIDYHVSYKGEVPDIWLTPRDT